MTVIAMSRREIDRMHVLRDMAAGRITASEAAQLMRLTRRHVFGLAKAYRERGGARAGGADLDAPRQAQQSSLSGGAVDRGLGPDQGQLPRLRPDAGPREVG